MQKYQEKCWCWKNRQRGCPLLRIDHRRGHPLNIIIKNIKFEILGKFRLDQAERSIFSFLYNIYFIGLCIAEYKEIMS